MSDHESTEAKARQFLAEVREIYVRQGMSAAPDAVYESALADVVRAAKGLIPPTARPSRGAS